MTQDANLAERIRGILEVAVVGPESLSHEGGGCASEVGRATAVTAQRQPA